MSRLSKWYAELKHLQEYHEADCAGIKVFDSAPNHLQNEPCHPDCTKCVLYANTFDKWFEETFE